MSLLYPRYWWCLRCPSCQYAAWRWQFDKLCTWFVNRIWDSATCTHHNGKVFTKGVVLSGQGHGFPSPCKCCGSFFCEWLQRWLHLRAPIFNEKTSPSSFLPTDIPLSAMPVISMFSTTRLFFFFVPFYFKMNDDHFNISTFRRTAGVIFHRITSAVYRVKPSGLS